MKAILSPVLLVLALCCTAQANAQRLVFKTGADLHEALQQDGAAHTNALNYVVGVVDALNGISSEHGFCFELKGEALTGARIADVVRSFLVKNPQMWDRPGSTLVAAALEEGWPCR